MTEIQALDKLVAGLSQGYMLHQVVVITGFFVLGLLFVYASGTASLFMTAASGDAVSEKETKPYDRGSLAAMLYAYPSGLALFSVIGYLMLCLGIPYTTGTMIIAMVLVGIICILVIVRKYDLVDIILRRKYYLIVILSMLCVLLLSVMLTINPFHVVVDNDSFFYFSAYPNAIVSEGQYTKYFDVFLTDAAPIGSIVQTLPYLFGFSETFGIQYFLDLNFLLIFGYALYTEFMGAIGRKRALVCAVGTVLFLVTSSAYLATAKWVMAGVYFMSYYFITAYLSYKAGGMGHGCLRYGGFSEIAGAKLKPDTRKPYVMLALMAVMTSMLRQEGVILMLVLVLTLSVLRGYSGKELASCFILPMLVASAIYYIRVFVVLDVHPLYAFLTAGKAIIIEAALLFCGAYLLFLRDKLGDRVHRTLPVLLPACALILNLGLMIMRSDRYFHNLYMFYLNVRIGAGWGYFGYIAAVILLLLIIKAIIKKEWYLSFFDSLMLTYVFTVFLVAFGRGDELRKGVGDSGNRVMLTVVPLVVFAVALRFLKDTCGDTDCIQE